MSALPARHRVLLLRHARAKSRRRWEGDDKERPLTKEGRAQAVALASLLAPFQPGRILSSPSLRCLQTVAPLADELALEVESCEDLAEGHGDKALDVLREMAPKTVVACSHGDVIPELLVAFSRRDGLDLPHHWAEMPKGSTWVLEGGGSGIESAYFLEAP